MRLCAFFGGGIDSIGWSFVIGLFFLFSIYELGIKCSIGGFNSVELAL